MRGIARDADEEVSVITKLTFRSPYRSGNATLETTGRKGQLPLHASFDAVIANGGTVTHHHAAGRDHRPRYGRQRPPLFAEALRAAKKALDPQGLLNPGVLIDPT